jgi:Domain of unknown function (DUF4287)
MPTSAAKVSSLYDVHPGVAMVQKWIAELKPKTGRSLEEWMASVKEAGPKEYQARRAWLKSKHKLGSNSAWWIAQRAEGKGDEEDTPEKYLATAIQYVEEQYSEKKSALRPITTNFSFSADLLAPTSKPALQNHNSPTPAAAHSFGLSGKMNRLITDDNHSYDFEYTLSDAK